MYSIYKMSIMLSYYSFIKNKTKKKILASSIALILIATAAAIGGTYALYSGSSSASTHITTGSLSFSFKRTKLVSNVLANSGLLEEVIDKLANQEELDKKKARLI